MSITPQAIQELLLELEASRASRKIAWNNLQEIRKQLESAGVKLKTPAQRSFESECKIVLAGIQTAITDRNEVIKDLAKTARRLDKAHFDDKADFGAAHIALLKIIDRAEGFV
jgi:hypothetical protein